MSVSAPKDMNDLHRQGQGIRQIADAVPSQPNGGRRHQSRVTPPMPWHERVITAAALRHKTFPPIACVVPNLIPDGLSMLAGRPKIGKSWLALEVALAVASNDGTCLGGLEVAHGNVLYAACEDGERRLQSRITRLLGAYTNDWPERLQLATAWQRLDQGGVPDIADWVQKVPSPRLVILDTLASVKPQRTTEGYSSDYAALEQLHRLANDAGIAILVLHHQRKNDADDKIDTISGTLGLAGAVDTPIILSGTPQGMTLYVRGRDIEEAEHAVTFDKAACRWTLQGDAAEFHRSDTRKKILAVLLGAKPNTMGPSEIAAAAGLNYDVVKKQLARMRGEVIKTSRGEYAHP